MIGSARGLMALWRGDDMMTSDDDVMSVGDDIMTSGDNMMTSRLSTYGLNQLIQSSLFLSGHGMWESRQ